VRLTAGRLRGACLCPCRGSIGRERVEVHVAFCSPAIHRMLARAPGGLPSGYVGDCGTQVGIAPREGGAPAKEEQYTLDGVPPHPLLLGKCVGLYPD
ncbi:unnamed protein product, partial [Mycena citricolor]